MYKYEIWVATNGSEVLVEDWDSDGPVPDAALLSRASRHAGGQSVAIVKVGFGGNQFVPEPYIRTGRPAVVVKSVPSDWERMR